MKNKNKLLWALSIIIVITMLCSLMATMVPGAQDDTPTPTPALLYPTARP